MLSVGTNGDIQVGTKIFHPVPLTKSAISGVFSRAPGLSGATP